MCRIDYVADAGKWCVCERYERTDYFGNVIHVGWEQVSPYYQTEGWAKRWAAKNHKMLTNQ